MVEFPDGKRKLVVTGTPYVSTTEILDLDTLQWTDGPGLPFPWAYTASVPYKNTFLVIGGLGTHSGTVYSTDIYEFDPVNMNWITRSETLTQGRHSHAAFLVPDDVVNCN